MTASAIVTTIIAIAIVLLARLWLRRLLSEETLASAPTAFMVGTAAAFYSIYAGFVFSVSFYNVQQIETISTTELLALDELGDIATRLPAPMAERLDAAVEGYLLTVVQSEFPSLGQGRASPQTTAALAHLGQTVSHIDAGNDDSTSLRTQGLENLTAVVQQRRTRILESQDRLPTVIWFTLIVGGVVVLGGASLLALDRKLLPAVLLSGLVASLVLILTTIHELDNPFRHASSASAKYYHEAWRALRCADPQSVAVVDTSNGC